MCFDYDHFLTEETLIIDDFGEICEDVVRIAGANAQYLCKDFDAELRRSESPGPPGNCIATERCFEKEVSSLFSEMEYLTEVSPGTDVVLAETNAITIAVNPSEFSCKRTVRCEPPTGAETPVATVQDCTVQASSPTDEPRQPVTRAQNRPSTGGLPKTARLHHCRDCGSSYGSNELLRKHSCIIAEQYQCHLCLREFKKRKTLDHHMKSHDKVFSTDDDLRKMPYKTLSGHKVFSAVSNE
uniref:C2H2-type domain-containing protein n=1 Tax=Anopheles epiroticus TaxID=199890 RepID=A0A182PDD1_9DIPT